MGLVALTKKYLSKSVVFELSAAKLKHNRVSYSQYGEDLFIKSYYDRLWHDRGIVVKKGIFVDIGAFRPIINSNSYLFYRLGWHCINVEPTPGMNKLFKAIRKSDTNLAVAVADEDGERTFYQFGSPSVWNTFDSTAALHAEKVTGNSPKEISIPVMRLETILKNCQSELPFEVLSIDAEGYDIEILKSNNFSTHSPRVIVIEVNEFDYKNADENPVVRFLSDRGYVMYAWINPNIFFLRGDSTLLRSI